MKKLLISLLLTLTFCLNEPHAMTSTKLTAPIAEKIPAETEVHNIKISDEYSWLRSKEWPKVEDKKILNYLIDENNYTNDYLSSSQDLQKQLFEEMKGRIKEDDVSYPVEKEGFFYYTKISKSQNYAVNCRKKGSMDAKEEIILDSNELAAKSAAFSLGALSINKKQNLLAYSTDLEGEERYKVYIKNLDTHTILKDTVKDTIGDVIWHQTIEGFFYAKIDKNWRHNKIFFHYLGTEQKDDILIFDEKDITFNVGAYKSSDSKYLFITASSSDEDETWYLDITAKDFTPKLTLARKKDQLYGIDSKNNELYLSINDMGKNFRLVKTAVESVKDPSKWQEIVAHHAEEYLTGFDLSKDYLIVTKKIKGLTNIWVYNNELKSKLIAFPDDAYSASGYFPTYEASMPRIAYSSLTTPSSMMEYEYDTEKLITRKTQEIPSGFRKDDYKAERIYATAKDGKKIPISLVYNKNLRKSEPQNLYLYGYGSYGHAISPSFNANIVSLLDRGFTFAIAHIRGGDDLGYEWYEEAKFLNKKLTFSDFLTCAEFLIEKNYTKKSQIVISGGSAGGMLVAVAANEKPELFKAVIARVPFVDVLNTMLDESLPLTPGEFKEWGNPKEKEYFDYIKSYSPYDNIKKQNYPAMFITGGLSDPRVTYWEPAKYAARLREYNLSNNPILLYTEMESGHQGQSGRYKSLEETAKVFSFILSLDNK
jgi:oligopeptidase B